MNAARFDDAIRALAGGTSRRSLLRGLTGGIAAAVAVKAMPAAATCTPPGPLNYCNADSECCIHSTCQLGICQCASGYKQCGTSCIPTTQTCLVCGSGPIKRCNGTCTDTRTDRNNCGYCGNTCGLKQNCSSGHCCAQGTIWCDNQCKPLSQCS